MHRIQRTKQYLKDRAPEIVTAVASVSTLIVVVRYLNSVNSNLELAQKAIPIMIDSGKPFNYYPGVGLYYTEPE